MDTHSRIQEVANNLEIENSRKKSHAKISEFTVLHERVFVMYSNFLEFTQSLNRIERDDTQNFEDHIFIFSLNCIC